MPRRPASPSFSTFEEMSRKSVADAASGSFGNVRTTPPCSRTNQREPSLGACIIAVGDVNIRFEKARGVSRPSVLQVGGGGGGLELPPFPPPPQAASASGRAAGKRRRRSM